jgi:hypothetical protein
MSANYRQLRAEVEEILGEAWDDLFEGAEETMDLAREISQDLIIALADGDEDMAEELIGQVRMLGELKRIEATNDSWEVAQRVVRVVWRTLVAAV